MHQLCLLNSMYLQLLFVAKCKNETNACYVLQRMREFLVINMQFPFPTDVFIKASELIAVNS